MAIILGGIASLLGGGGAAAGTAATAGAAAGTAATSGFSLASILQGTATVLGVVSTIGAGFATADQMKAQAIDAEMEQSLETLQGINRRSSIKAAMRDAVGAQDLAYAGSGVDLTFGTAVAARKDAYREADLALTTAVGTEQTRVNRLTERAANYRRGAKQAKLGGIFEGAMKGIGGYLDWKDNL